MSANTLDHHVSVELIHEGFKYKTTVTKSGLNSYFLIMNGSFKEIEVHRLSDGGEYTIKFYPISVVFYKIKFQHKFKEFCYPWMVQVLLLICEKKSIDTES